MLSKLLPVGTLLLFAAALMIVPETAAFADDWKCESRQYERYGPPGHQAGQHRWIPPGQLKKMQRQRQHDCRYHDNRYRDSRYRDSRDRNGYVDTRDSRYEPRAPQKYDRGDYGLIIRKGSDGTIDVGYGKRDR